MAPRLLRVLGAAALLPGAALASPGTCAALNGCKAIADAVGGEEGSDDSALLQVSRQEPAAVAALAAEAEGDWKRPQLTFAVWNIAYFAKATPTEIAKTLAQLGVDIIGTNEDVEFNESSQDNALSIPGYTKAVSCRAEALWDQERAYAWGGRWFQNAIYVRDETVTWVRRYTKNISIPEVVGDYLRCAAVVDVRAKSCSKQSLPIRVATVHLTGGRYIDSNFIDFEGEKGHEVRQALTLRPDILMGDLNSYPDTEQVRKYQQSYGPYTSATSAGQLDQYLGWTIEGTQEADRAGYLRVPNFENTTQYGGTVDHIYLRPDVDLKLSRSFQALGADIVGSFEQSDHNLVSSGVIILEGRYS